MTHLRRLLAFSTLSFLLVFAVSCGSADEDGDSHDADSADVLADASNLDVEATDEGVGGEDSKGADSKDSGSLPPVGPKVHIRVVAANLTSGKKQSYDPGHGIRILQGLKPDIVLIQEFNYGSKTQKAIDGFVDKAFGSGFHWVREPKGAIPNGVISRWPMLDWGYWESPLSPNREFAWAKIDIPGPVDLWAVSVHLLTSKASTRQKQAANLRAYIEKNVPDGDFLIIGGDLNTNSAGEKTFNELDQITSRAHRPRDHNGNRNTNADRSKPYDWLLPDDDLELFHDSVRIGAGVYSHGLIFDSRVYAPLADVKPVLATDSKGSGMQHMAVVRDFLVPGDP